MTTEQFAYWLQGFAELNTEPPTAEQWQAIRDHLALVFEKKTPPVNIGITPGIRQDWQKLLSPAQFADKATC